MTDDPLYRREVLRLAADATGAGHLAAPDASGHRPQPCLRRPGDGGAGADGWPRSRPSPTPPSACVLTQASAAILAADAPGMDRTGLAGLAGEVRAFLTGRPGPRRGYAVFDGVADHAGRHVCVLLPLEAALEGPRITPNQALNGPRTSAPVAACRLACAGAEAPAARLPARQPRLPSPSPPRLKTHRSDRLPAPDKGDQRQRARPATADRRRCKLRACFARAHQEAEQS